MIQGLIATLQALAAPAEVRLGRFPDLRARADELALDYSDAWLTCRQCPGLAWTADQEELLDELDAVLEDMTGRAKAVLWTDEARRHGAEWDRVRRLARQALVALGASVEDPPTSDAPYLPG